MNVNSINWFTENLAEFIGKADWSLTGAYISGDKIVINPKGYVETILVRKSENTGSKDKDSILSTSRYMKIGVDIQGEVQDIDRYKPVLTVDMKDIYKTDDTDFRSSTVRKISINRNCITGYSPFDSNSLHFVQLVQTEGKPLEKMKIRISNNSNEDKIITWLGLYCSNDLGDRQYQEIQKEAIVNFGTFIEARLDDPENPQLGRIWLRVDLEVKEETG